MKRLLLITLLIGYIYPCVAQDKPIRTEESLEGTVIYKKTTTFEVDGYTYQCDEMCIRDRVKTRCCCIRAAHLAPLPSSSACWKTAYAPPYSTAIPTSCLLYTSRCV